MFSMLTIASRCWLCNQPLHKASHGICSLCIKRLPKLPCCCPRCGLPSGSSSLPCGRCLLKSPLWQSMIFVSDYQPPIRSLILRFKFSATPELGTTLARLLLLRWLPRYRQGSVPKPDWLLCVPLHRRRFLSRGYNQAALIAAPLARWLGCHYQPDTLRRNRATKPQQSLKMKARRRNLRHAFSCQQNLRGKHVALIDDVITTGSTLTEIAKILRDQGVASLQVWCICRTL